MITFKEKAIYCSQQLKNMEFAKRKDGLIHCKETENYCSSKNCPITEKEINDQIQRNP